MTELSPHTLTAFEQDLNELSSLVVDMGGRVELMLNRSMQALMTLDEPLAQQVRHDDREIDQNQHDVEEKAIIIIAKRQPMAMDLREVIASIRIAGDLERIGDLAKNGAKRVTALAEGHQLTTVMQSLKNMGALCSKQLNHVMIAYANKNKDEAEAVWKQDSELDSLYNSIFRELLTYMMEKPAIISHCTHLLFIAKNLERIGDHATNIAEAVYYLEAGSTLGDDRPKGDNTSYVAM